MAIHKKKIKDLRNWLLQAFCFSSTHRGSTTATGKVLVLSGPSGTGKTAALRVLSRELDFEIVEWENSININAFQSVWDRQASLDDNGKIQRFSADYVPVLQRFQDFLGSACKIPALHFAPTDKDATLTAAQGSAHTHVHTRSPYSVSSSRRKIVLVEDWPQLGSASSRAAVHAALRMHMSSHSSAYPLVLIISDVSDVHQAGNSSFRDIRFQDLPVTLRTLIPSDISARSSYTHIKFNHVAPTILTKALTRIADVEFRSAMRRKYKPSRMVIEWIAKTSSGDIRHAIHRLQFLALADMGSIPKGLQLPEINQVGRGKKRRASKRIYHNGLESIDQLCELDTTSEHSTAGGGYATFDPACTALNEADCRDESVSIFQAVGRIRYNKRLDVISECEHVLSAGLSRYMRTALQVEPESIFSRLYVDPEVFSLFAEQNILSAMNNVDELVLATSYLSDSDLYTGRWENRHVLEGYSMSVSARGLMFSHCQSPLVVAAISDIKGEKSGTASIQSKSYCEDTGASSAGSRNTFLQMHKPEEWPCRAKIREHRAVIHAGLARGWTERYIKLTEIDTLEEVSQSELVISHHLTESLLWREVVPFLGLLGRTNKHPPVRNLPVYAKSALAGVCGYTHRAASESLHEGSYDGGMEYLDAIEDLGGLGPGSARISGAAAFSSGTDSHRRLEWKDHLALAEDDIEEF